MSGTLKQRLESLTAKMKLLEERHKAMAADAEARREEIEQLNLAILRRDREMDVLRQQAEHLRVVHAITPSREHVERSRAILTELMRDIDKCIADIGE